MKKQPQTPKHYRPPGKRKEGVTAKYITRNKALTRLQLKLSEFRRLCILKGIHPREPKKKFEGQNKTYYHVKDINFLAHEPLLQKSRDIRAYEKKIKKARAKLNNDLAKRLETNRPSFTLDHLVKERYPHFIDALRDMDDPLTLIHLFATLPSDTTHKIPVERVHNCRRLSLEWQAYVTRTHSLRKVFVSVKGIYYQAEVSGQKITWLTPHLLSQVLPDDVDFRVMLTFVEFYETMISFVNFRLYYLLGLRYPPILDPHLEQVAAELYAVMRDLSAEGLPHSEEATMDTQSLDLMKDDNTAELTPEQVERRIVESQARLASLQDRLRKMDRPEIEDNGNNDAEAVNMEEDNEDEETKLCKNLFKDLKFYLSREVPRESLLFVIRAFGGTVTWDGEGAPFDEADETITHQIVDRPCQGHIFLSREYVQPQWIYDCANSRLILPTYDYGIGRIPPPHLSPFIDNEAEGHVPEYAESIKRLQLAAKKQLLPLPGAEEEAEEVLANAASRRLEDAEKSKQMEIAAMERVYAEDLAKEVAENSQLDPKLAKVETGKDISDSLQSAEDDAGSMGQMMMSRKKRKLYEAMQMGKEKKRANVELIKQRKKKLDEKKRAKGE